jgi:hypothetical protein
MTAHGPRGYLTWWRTPEPAPEPAPSPPASPRPVPHRPMPRLAVGLRWSLLVAEMAAEAAKRTEPAPNPWTPEDPEGAAA